MSELLWRERLDLANSKLKTCHKDDRKHWMACRDEATQMLIDLHSTPKPLTHEELAFQRFCD